MDVLSSCFEGSWYVGEMHRIPSRRLTPLERVTCLVAAAAIVLFAELIIATVSYCVERFTKKNNGEDVEVKPPILRSAEDNLGIEGNTGGSILEEEVNRQLNQAKREFELIAFGLFREIEQCHHSEDKGKQLAPNIKNTILEFRAKIMEDVRYLEASGIEAEILLDVYESASAVLKDRLNAVGDLKGVDPRDSSTIELDNQRIVISAKLWNIAKLAIISEENEALFINLCNQAKKLGVDMNLGDFGKIIGSGETLLHHIGKRGRLGHDHKQKMRLLSALSDSGVSFSVTETNHNANTPLVWAIANANDIYIELAEFMDNRGINLNCGGNTALHLAVAKGYRTRDSGGKKLNVPYTDLVKALIRHSANLELYNDRGDREGYTALHIACLKHDVEMIQILMKAGANVKTLTKEGKSCLELLEGEYDVVKDIMKTTTGNVYGILPEEDFKKAQEQCRQSLTNNGAVGESAAAVV